MAAPARSTVLDVAYARLEVSGRPGLRIGTLIESINDDHVVLNGVRRSTSDAWAMAARDVLGDRADVPVPDTLVVAHPTTWGRRRVAVVLEAVSAAVAPATPTTTSGGVLVLPRPRATLVAATHLEPSAQVCVVAEAHDGRLDIHRLVRDDDGWAVQRTDVLDEHPASDEVGPLVDDAVEAILVDGDNTDRIAATIRVFEDATPTGRVAAVERVLLHRFGGESAPVDDLPPPPTADRRAPSPRRRALLVGAVAIAVAAAVAGVLVVTAPWSSDGPTTVADTGSAAPATVRADVGRVSMVVPAEWRRESDAADATGAIGFTTFAARTDDRRLLMVQNSVREDSTPASVATSLRNRLRQSGADAVSEFSATTRYGGRDVIAYRETPGSGAPIRWYVVVGSALQVSVGCQPGSRGQSVDDECRDAVSSVAIAPLR